MKLRISYQNGAARWGVSLLCLVVLGFTSGCGRIARIRECRAVVGLVNGSLESIEAKARPRTPAAYRSAAKGYVELAKQLRGVRFSHAPTRTALDEYAGMLEAVVPSVESYAQTLETKDARHTSDAERSLERFRRQQRALISRIDGYCHAP